MLQKQTGEAMTGQSKCCRAKESLLTLRALSPLPSCYSYYINLDPAVTQVPFGANIDIRDTVSSTLIASDSETQETS